MMGEPTIIPWRPRERWSLEQFAALPQRWSSYGQHWRDRDPQTGRWRLRYDGLSCGHRISVIYPNVILTVTAATT